MNTKYLSDGRKVAVIGKLNNEQSIVQEVFVTDAGDEIPSGERFTATSLHDTPVESYKAKEGRRLVQRAEELKAQISKHKEELRSSQNLLAGYRELVKSTKIFTDNLNEQDLETFAMFITGSMQYLVFTSEYGDIKPPVKFEDRFIQVDAWGGIRSYEGIKLLSVAGKTNGELDYWLHNYSDGSGGYQSVKPFATYENAVAYIREKAIEKIRSDRGISKDSYDTCIAMGIEFPAEVLMAYREARAKRLSDYISKREEEQSKVSAAISGAREELEELGIEQ